ncbi:MAG: urease accessory protein UreF [Egibacteraceae bacterium]
MPPEAAGGLFSLLGVLQLADSFFPSGRYTLSHGLESFVQCGWVEDPADLEALIEEYLTAVVGGADAVAAAEAARCAAAADVATIVEIDRRLHSMKLAHEAAVSSVRTGRQLLATARGLCASPPLERYADRVSASQAPGNHAVALGVFGAAWGLTPAEAALVELYSFATGLLGAALRMLRLGHTQAQGILRRLGPSLDALAQQASCTSYEDMRAFAPAVEIMQMRHERADVRLFAS